MQSNLITDIASFKTALSAFNIREHGDVVEINGSKLYGMDQAFPNYETLWRNHVVPATERPVNIRFRANTNRVIQQLGQASYAVFKEMFNAETYFKELNNNNLGGVGKSNLTSFIKAAGDSLQQLDRLQKVIEKGLEIALQRPISLNFSPDKDTWLQGRAKVIGYRNALTHSGEIAMFEKNDVQGNDLTYVLDPSVIEQYFDRKKNLTWTETNELYNADPSKFVHVIDACKTLKDDTYQFLRTTYSVFQQALDQLLSIPEYQNLWGMASSDLQKIMSYSGVTKSLDQKQITTSSSFPPPSGSFQG